MEHLSNQLRASLGAPLVSGYYLSLAELLRREASATQRAEALAAAIYPPGAARRASVTYHGRAILWHDDFPAGLGIYLCDTPGGQLLGAVSETMCSPQHSRPCRPRVLQASHYPD